MNQYPWLDEYLLSKPGCTKDYKAEWGWWRYQVGGKLFAALCQPGPKYTDYDCRELLTVKCEPMLAELLRSQYPDVIPGFYMDKRNWNSIYLDGELPEEVLRRFCDDSYSLVFDKLTKKLQKEIKAASE
ncbi:MAG: MmcQ/YjbR family DNA-binding protein [Oscillospiraceae bacterium]|nr:MmcQ/YjbR family DNA-binding protein [Oscillospiraceae bacterium]